MKLQDFSREHHHSVSTAVSFGSLYHGFLMIFNIGIHQSTARLQISHRIVHCQMLGVTHADRGFAFLVVSLQLITRSRLNSYLRQYVSVRADAHIKLLSCNPNQYARGLSLSLADYIATVHVMFQPHMKRLESRINDEVTCFLGPERFRHGNSYCARGASNQNPKAHRTAVISLIILRYRTAAVIASPWPLYLCVRSTTFSSLLKSNITCWRSKCSQVVHSQRNSDIISATKVRLI